MKELRDLITTIKELRKVGRYRESANISERAIQIAHELGDYQSELKAVSNKIINLFNIGDVTRATIDLLQYARLCKEHGSKADFMLYYNIAGEFHGMLNHFEQAKEYLLKSMELSKELEDDRHLCIVYSNLARIHFLEEDYEQSLSYGLLSLQSVENCNIQCQKEETNFFITLKAHLADAYTSLKQFDLAKELIEEIKQHPSLNKLWREKGIVLRSEAMWHEAQQQYEQAYNKFIEAKRVFNSYGDIYLLKRLNRQLLSLLEKMDRAEELCKVQQDYIEIFELLEKENHNRISVQLDMHEDHAVIEERVYHDPLTGIHNRLFIEEQSLVMLEDAHTSKQSVACILFDIDHFKYFNDEHGHLFGDEVIKLIANYANDYFKEDQAVFSRFGGDEFVGLMKYEQWDTLNDIVRNLHQALCRLTIKKDGQSIPIYVSMGVSHNNKGRLTNFEELFHIADEALYESKNNGRRRVTLIE